MKRIVLVLTACAVLLLLVGCQPEVTRLSVSDLNALTRFSGDDLPGMMVQTGEQCVYFSNTYGKSDYSLCVGSSFDEVESVYTASGVSIWFLEANDHAAAWCEKTEDAYTYYIYDLLNQEVCLVYTADAAAGFQLQNVGLYGRKLYISCVDYSKESAGIYSIDMDTLERDLILSMPYYSEYSTMSFAVEDKYLTVAGKGNISVIDLAQGDTLLEYQLGETIGYIYAVSFDAENMTCAFYCQNGDKEDICMIGTDGNMISIYSFGQHCYAYHDRILCREGHIYWVLQANVSGEIVDHYDLIDYDYLEHKPVEIDKVFHVSIGENSILLLSFGESPKDIILSEYPSR